MAQRWGFTEYALLGTAAVLAFSGGSAEPAGGWNPGKASGGIRRLRELGHVAGMPDDAISFLQFVAYGESGGNNLRGLGIPSMFPDWAKPTLGVSTKVQNAEARAAQRGYNRNAAIFEGCGWPPEMYAFGSGGWFGMLPPYGLAQLKRSELRCLSPYSVFDPVASIVQGYGFGRGLQGWKGYRGLPTVANLRMGWGLPSSMGNVERLAKRRNRYERHMRAIGLPTSFLDHRMSRWPSRSLQDMYSQLGGAAVNVLSAGTPPELEGMPGWSPDEKEALGA